MSPYLTLAILVFLLATLCTGFFYLVAHYSHLLPAIRSRDIHSTPKPRLGGVAMWLTIMLAFAVLLGSTKAGLLNFHAPLVWGIPKPLLGVMLGMGILLIFGILDDLYSLAWGTQLVGQFLSALMLVIFGVGVTFIRLPFGHVWDWGQIGSIIFTLLWVMTMINVLNFFDGLDGLAASVTLTACIVLFFVSQRVDIAATATLTVILGATVAGFLPWNWYPSRTFMGTVGSQTLGFLLAVIAIISGGKVATSILVLGIPLLDAILVVLRRIVAGAPPFKADQRHLHHRLLKLGLSVTQVVVVINLVAIVFGFSALYVQQSSNAKGLLMLLLITVMVAFLLVTHFLERRKPQT